jgi:ABC-type sugar transport system permease subunit
MMKYQGTINQILKAVALGMTVAVLVLGILNATTVETSITMPGSVRLAHVIELGFSMAVVGIFMVWLFVKEKAGQG